MAWWKTGNQPSCWGFSVASVITAVLGAVVLYYLLVSLIRRSSNEKYYSNSKKVNLSIDFMAFADFTSVPYCRRHWWTLANFILTKQNSSFF
jgi:hypothetical protein